MTDANPSRSRRVGQQTGRNETRRLRANKRRIWGRIREKGGKMIQERVRERRETERHAPHQGRHKRNYKPY